MNIQQMSPSWGRELHTNWILRTTACIYFLFVAIILATTGCTKRTVASQRMLRPPFRKVWEFPTTHQLVDFFMVGDSLYYDTFNSYGAVNLKTGERLWEKTLSDEYSTSHLAYDGGILYVTTGLWKVLACDPKTGQEIWSLPIQSYPIPAAHNGLLFCELRPGLLTALDTRTRKPIWKAELVRPSAKVRDTESEIRDKPVFSGEKIILTLFPGEIICSSWRTGKISWRHRLKKGKEADSDWVSGLAADERQVYFTAGGRSLVALELQSGKEVWRFATEEDICYDTLRLMGNLLLLGSQDGIFYAVNRGNGKKQWAHTLSKKAGTIISPATLHHGKLLVAAHSKLFAFDASGKKLWEWDSEEPLHGEPITVLEDGLLLSDSFTFLRFSMGEAPRLPSAPSGRLALARRLAARLDNLSRDERRTLHKLGEEAFAALLPVVKKKMLSYERILSQGKQKDAARHEMAEQQFTVAIEDLSEVATKKHTTEMLDLLDAAKSAECRFPIYRWLAERGDDRLTVPLFLDVMKSERAKMTKNPNDFLFLSPYGFAIKVLSNSMEPEAVQFLIQEMANPRADPDVCHEAYLNLARTGGDAGLQAVLKARDTERTIPSLSQFIQADKLPFLPKAVEGPYWHQEQLRSRLLEIQMDRNGILWGLVSSRALGSSQDLWVVSKRNNTWTDPLFAGVTEGGLGKSDWFARFAGNPELGKDRDGDGWTDLVEKRLGTDPGKADTDGDGLIDSHDKNPLASPRKLSEAEEVLAAAFEGRFHFSEKRNVPCLVLLPEGIKPLELHGWGWIIIPARAKEDITLKKVSGEGVAIISFHPPEYDFNGSATRKQKSKEFILWNKGHTEAKLHLVAYFGSLDATGFDIRLKKFGSHWVVIEARMIWIA